MKHIHTKLLAALICLGCGIQASAYDFYAENSDKKIICYNITSEEELTVSVTALGDAHGLYAGDINIPAQVTNAGTGIEYTVTAIGAHAFSQCNQLTSVTIPNGITTIGSFAFNYCSNLTSVTIPSSVTKIENSAFQYCERALNRVNIESIEAWCNIDFESYDSNPLYYEGLLYLNGTEVTDLVIPNTITKINNFAFNRCSSLTSVTIPNSVTSIGINAFQYCKNLTNVTIGNSVTSIGNHAFSACSLLTITIPSSVTSIGDYAFSQCDLTSITIGSSVTSIGDHAFWKCNNLANVTNLSTTPQSIRDNVFSIYGNLHVLPGCGDAYSKDDVWNKFNIIEEDPTKRTITLGASEYATYYADVNLDFSEVEGLKAYVASSFDASTSTLIIARVEKVPAGEGILLKGTAEASYNVPITDKMSVVANLFKGSNEALTLNPTDGDKTNFVLTKNAQDQIGFYRFSGTVNMPANKAWLQIPTAVLGDSQASTLGFRLVEEGEEMSGVAEISSVANHNDVIYDLQGRRLNSAPAGGLYIINGKKVFK